MNLIIIIMMMTDIIIMITEVEIGGDNHIF